MDYDLVRLVVFAIIIVGAVVLKVLESKRERKKREQIAEMTIAAKAEAAAQAAAEGAQAGGFSGAVTPAAAPPNTAQTFAAAPKIEHDIPNNPELAAYMQDLPQVVLGVADAQRVATKLESDMKMGLWQTAVNRVIAHIQPNELIYAMTWNAHCASMNLELRKKQESHGVVFFSNMRFFYFKDPANIIEFPLVNIYTVADHRGHYFDGISFRTQSMDIKLSFAGTIDRKLFRDMVIYIAANAAAYQPDFDGADASDVSAKPQICECPGCGATVIIHANIKNKCEYCGRFVEKQQFQPASVTVADEIKKYKDLMDNGVISEAEFEEVKNRLLSRL